MLREAVCERCAFFVFCASGPVLATVVARSLTRPLAGHLVGQQPGVCSCCMLRHLHPEKGGAGGGALVCFASVSFLSLMAGRLMLFLPAWFVVVCLRGAYIEPSSERPF